MFDSNFREQWRESRKGRWGNSTEAFKKNTRGFVSMLKDRWSNFETEMMASVFSLTYLSEIAADDLYITEKDLEGQADLDSAALRLADYLKQDSLKVYSLSSNIEFPVNELGEPFRTMITTMIENVDFAEIARTFLESEARSEI